jgi:hypothetical protein
MRDRVSGGKPKVPENGIANCGVHIRTCSLCADVAAVARVERDTWRTFAIDAGRRRVTHSPTLRPGVQCEYDNVGNAAATKKSAQNKGPELCGDTYTAARE